MLFEVPEGAILLYSLRRPRRAAEGVPLTGQATTNVDTHAYEFDVLGELLQRLCQRIPGG